MSWESHWLLLLFSTSFWNLALPWLVITVSALDWYGSACSTSTMLSWSIDLVQVGPCGGNMTVFRKKSHLSQSTRLGACRPSWHQVYVHSSGFTTSIYNFPDCCLSWKSLICHADLGYCCSFHRFPRLSFCFSFLKYTFVLELFVQLQVHGSFWGFILN